MPPLVASTFRHRGTLSPIDVGSLLTDLADGLRSRRIQIENGRQQITVSPRELIDCLLELASAGGDHSLIIRLTWAHHPLAGQRQAIALPDVSRPSALSAAALAAEQPLRSAETRLLEGDASEAPPSAHLMASATPQPSPPGTGPSVANVLLRPRRGIAGEGGTGRVTAAVGAGELRRREAVLHPEDDFRLRMLDSPDRAADYLQALATCFRNGTLLFASGSAEILMQPSRDIDIAVDIRRRARRSRVRVIMHWHHRDHLAISPGRLRVSVPPSPTGAPPRTAGDA